MPRRAARSLVGERVIIRYGLLWLRTGQGTVRATYEREGRQFASVELDGSGKVVPRLVTQLRPAGGEKS
jgi:hypothetical protein